MKNPKLQRPQPENILILNYLNNTCISQPSRHQALLDLIIFHKDESFLYQCISELAPEISDHSATDVDLPFQCPLHKSFTRSV